MNDAEFSNLMNVMRRIIELLEKIAQSQKEIVVLLKERQEK